MLSLTGVSASCKSVGILPFLCTCHGVAHVTPWHRVYTGLLEGCCTPLISDKRLHCRFAGCFVPLQDGGDPDVAVSPRDIVFTLDASEAAAAAAKGSDLEPSVLATTDLRCGGVSWCDGELLTSCCCWGDAMPVSCSQGDMPDAFVRYCHIRLGGAIALAGGRQRECLQVIRCKLAAAANCPRCCCCCVQVTWRCCMSPGGKRAAASSGPLHQTGGRRRKRCSLTGEQGAAASTVTETQVLVTVGWHSLTVCSIQLHQLVDR